MYANYTARSIKKVCKEIGPRFAGSEAEKKGIDPNAKKKNGKKSKFREKYSDRIKSIKES